MQDELAKWKASSPSRTLVSPQLANTSSLPPIWNHGDEWAYRYEGPSGSGTYIWSVDREELIDGVPHYVIKTGTREIFYRKSDFASTRETVDGIIVLKNTPSRFQLVWPVQVGKTWEQTVLEERPLARQTIERVEFVTVESEETVTVPAGTFKTLKVVYRNKKTAAIRYEAWYALDVKQVVKLRENLESGLRVRELIAFKLHNDAQPATISQSKNEERAPSRDEEKVRATRVRIVTNPEIVKGCQALGSATDDDIPDLQRKVLRLGGDVGLVTLQSGESRGAFSSGSGGFRSRTYTTVDVYRCGP